MRLQISLSVEHIRRQRYHGNQHLSIFTKLKMTEPDKDRTKDSRTQIVLAMIGLVGILVPAILGNLDKLPSIGIERTNEHSNNIKPEQEVERKTLDFVVYSDDNRPVEGVEVEFIFSGAPTPKKTDSNGYVSIEILARDSIQVVLRKDGFKTERRRLNLEANEDEPDFIFLEREVDSEEVSKNTQPSELSTSASTESLINPSPVTVQELTPQPRNSQLPSSTPAAPSGSPTEQEPVRTEPSKPSPPQPQATNSPIISDSGVAIVFDPPSNVRKTPNGEIICSVIERGAINISGSTENWYYTDVCGTRGVIHRSQITFQPD